MTSMPAVGIRTTARIFTEVVGKVFELAGQLAFYAGLAPVTWRSGSRSEAIILWGGGRLLKRALFLSEFGTLKDLVSRAYYDKKRAEHGKHSYALIALTRRRCNVMYAMLRGGAYLHMSVVATAV